MLPFAGSISFFMKKKKRPNRLFLFYVSYPSQEPTNTGIYSNANKSKLLCGFWVIVIKLVLLLVYVMYKSSKF